MVTAPKKHYVVGRIVNPSRIHGRINNPSYIANNPNSIACGAFHAPYMLWLATAAASLRVGGGLPPLFLFLRPLPFWDLRRRTGVVESAAPQRWAVCAEFADAVEGDLDVSLS